jgi:hypothetical protein
MHCIAGVDRSARGYLTVHEQQILRAKFSDCEFKDLTGPARITRYS